MSQVTLAFHLLQEGPRLCLPQIDFFLQLSISTVEAAKLTHHGE